MKQIAFDTETTGLDPKSGHRIIEIGCVEMINRQLTGKEFHCYINPERELDPESLKITGIQNDFLLDKPLFKEIALDFLDFIKDSEVIAHNADFDVNFINHEFGLSGLNLGKMKKYCQVIDTLTMARKLHPGQRNSLDALSKRYKINHFDRTLHGALLDAQILAHVYLAMTSGQSTLFGGSNHQTQTQKNTVTQKIQRSDKNIPIIHPDEKELAAHTAYIEMLNKKTDGKCVWN